MINDSNDSNDKSKEIKDSNLIWCKTCEYSNEIDFL